MQNVADYLVYLIVRLFVCAVQTLSLATCQRVARWLAWVACDVAPLRRRVVDENLQRAFPRLSPAERTQLARQMWEHLFLMVCEIAHAPRKIHDTNWRRYIRFPNQAPMMRLLWSERPKVFVAGHYGNFELGGYTMGLFGFQTYAVARPLDNKYLDRFIKRFREAKGQHILPKQGSADEIAELLAKNRTLSVLGDQHAGPKGCWVDFFGAPASTHKAIALFALSNDAPLAVGYARRLDQPLEYEMGVEAIADGGFRVQGSRHGGQAGFRVQDADSPGRKTGFVSGASAMRETWGLTELTQWFTTVLEGLIRRAPDQYWWVHRRWKGEPPVRVRKAA
ncbi:MAG: lysophospholipid acyltransferase family protein [Pirellulales bacterium]